MPGACSNNRSYQDAKESTISEIPDFTDKHAGAIIAFDYKIHSLEPHSHKKTNRDMILEQCKPSTRDTQENNS